MQSTLRQCDGDKTMAEKYSQLNDEQIVVGKRLLLSLNIKHGEALESARYGLRYWIYDYVHCYEALESNEL